MKINWEVRLKNKTWLLAMAAAVLTFVYQVLGLMDIVPLVSQDQITQLISVIINILATLGIVIDPTTKGIRDSARALEYKEPKK